METGCVDPNTAAEFLEGLLSVDVASGVEAHMARCSECRRLIAALAQDGSPALDTDPEPFDDDALASTGVDKRFQVKVPDDALAEGTKVGRFIVLQRLGAGGMGVIYAAYDPHLDRKVALKFLRGDAADGSHRSADARARLIGEAQAIARITHPNIISVYDVGEYESQVYIAMELIDGLTLTRWLRKQRRDWRDVRDAFAAAARGLAAAHAGDIVHRDFKPENVMVGPDDRVYVMDFGLARTVEEEREPTPAGEGEQASALGASLTRTGAILGTPRYMAPEQFAGRTADARSDQFSLCVALYEALYRTYPFYGETAAQLTPSLAIEDQLRPVERDREVPAFLRAAVLRGMSVDPDDRFESMEALMDALRDPISHATKWVAAAAAVPVILAAVFVVKAMSDEDSARAEASRAEELAAQEQHRRVDAEREMDNLRDEIALLREEVRRLEVEEQKKLFFETELAKREALLLDKQEQEQRRREAARERRVYEESLDKGLVKRRVTRRRRALETCYQRGRDMNPTMGQWVTTEFSISREGNVLWVNTRGLRSRGAAECVKSVIKSIEFPKSSVATIATFAFDFEPRRSRTYVELREGATEAGDEGELLKRIRADGLVCDPRDPLCGAE